MSIKIAKVKNAQSLNFENTCFKVQIKHPEHGWIPYHLAHYDTDNTINNEELLVLIGTNFKPYVPPTQKELDEVAAEEVRRTRDLRLRDQVDPILCSPERRRELGVKNLRRLLRYRKSLLNITNQAGFPHKTRWPKEVKG